MTAQNGNKKKEKGGFKATVLVPVGSNLTGEVPTPPLGNLGTDTTHEVGHAQGRTTCVVREKGRYTPKVSG